MGIIKVQFMVVCIALLSQSAHAEEKTVSTSGQCFRKAEADRGSIYLGVQVIEKDANSASKKASQIYEKVREFIKKQNLKDAELSTTALSIEREESWEDSSMLKGGKTVFKGYRASVGVELTTSEIARLGEMTAKAAELGSNQIGNLRVFLSRATQVDEERACLEAAVKDAKAKAVSMAQALGQKVDRAIRIVEGGSGGPQSYEMVMAKSSGGFSGMKSMASVVETKPIEVSVNVQVVFELK